MTPDRARSAPAIHFLTLGCPKNEVDSDRMRALVAGSAFRIANDLDDADVVVVNTCAFIQDAVEESISAVLDLAQDWRPAGPDRRIVVAGCMPSRYGLELETALTEADAFVPVAEEGALLGILDRLTGHRPGETRGPARSGDVGPSAYLQVSDGCHRSCSYCTIPTIRGPYRSRPLGEIGEEAAFLARRGAREIVLIGQDISAYGRDLGVDHTLANVVRTVATTEGVAWTRLMYVQPDGVTDDLLDTMASLPSVCHYLDIPLQHVAPHVLNAMHRPGSAEQFLGLLDKIRSHMPDIALRTTMMTGFPGETEADVAALVDFVEQAHFDYVGVFAFSPEPGTRAASLDRLPPAEERARRAQTLRDAADVVGVERAAALVGSALEVLSLGLDDDDVPVGRWRGQAPEVDGLVLLDTEVPTGALVNVSVTDSYGYDLEGHVTP